MDIKFVQIRDYETNVEPEVQDIVSTLRRKVGGKIFHVDVTFANMDNVSFPPKTIFQNRKYVLQTKIDVEGKLGEGAL